MRVGLSQKNGFSDQQDCAQLSIDFHEQPTSAHTRQVIVGRANVAPRGSKSRQLPKQFLRNNISHSTSASLAPYVAQLTGHQRQVLAQCNYPQAPAVIESAWSILVQVVAELYHHTSPKDASLAQTVRRVQMLKNAQSKRLQGRPTIALEPWLNDVLILMGTLPTESTHVAQRSSQAHIERLSRAISQSTKVMSNAITLSSLDLQSRAEALQCLEMLCSRAWYDKYRRGASDVSIEDRTLRALAYMYWECGICDAVIDELGYAPQIDHPAFNAVRRENYRQLYAIESEGLMLALFERIESGCQMLYDRRCIFERRYVRQALEDKRRDQDVIALMTQIHQKYTAMLLNEVISGSAAIEEPSVDAALEQAFEQSDSLDELASARGRDGGVNGGMDAH